MNFLSLLLYLLVPWTAINLTDFYLIRKGVYHVESFFEADGGIYGRFNAAALGAYAIGVLFELPFMILHTPSYTGFMVDNLGGADISWIVGLVVTIPVYYALARASEAARDRRATGDGRSSRDAGSGHDRHRTVVGRARAR